METAVLKSHNSMRKQYSVVLELRKRDEQKQKI